MASNKVCTSHLYGTWATFNEGNMTGNENLSSLCVVQVDHVG